MFQLTVYTPKISNNDAFQEQKRHFSQIISFDFSFGKFMFIFVFYFMITEQL